MSVQKTREMISRLGEALRGKKFEELYSCVSNDYMEHTPGIAPGVDGLVDFMRNIAQAFPDAQLEIKQTVVEGDLGVYRWTLRGTHKGMFMNVPATSRKVTATGMDMWRVSDGMLAEHWSVFDTLGIMQQLDAIPAPEQTQPQDLPT
ncbi:MAG: ester cyclase [Anaerolineae bacterium]